MPVPARVFVYGSLLPGEMRHPVLESSRPLGPALIRGRLYDLGRYPALTAGPGSVVGEVFEVDGFTLRQLDRIEGWTPQVPGKALYRRQQETVRYLADGRHERVFVYRYNRKAGGRLIGHGDYRRQRLERAEDAQWVLAYGSNLCPDRLSARVGTPLALERGAVPGFVLRFNKHAQGGGSACANLGWAGGHARCPAVAWKLEPQQIEALDACEGTPDHYLKVALPFLGERRGWRLCQAYVAHPDRLTDRYRPTEVYANHLRRGYAHHGFDSRALERLLAPSRAG